MLTFLYFVMTVIHLIALYFIFKLFMQNRKSYTLLAMLAIIGLAYDNLIIGIGQFIGEGSLLAGLNAIRFYTHALITPLLIIFAFGVLRQIGISWASIKVAHSLFCLLATILIVMGVQTDIINLVLIPEIEQDTLRYVNDASSGPPIPAIITIIVMIIVGIIVSRKIQWHWLVLGSIIMFVASAIGFNAIVVSNMGEVIFALAIVGIDYRVQRERALAMS